VNVAVGVIGGPPLKWRLRRAEWSQTGRAEGFSDGVFAVAITLLALDLSGIHATAGVGDGTLGAAFQAYWPRLLAFAASFAFIGVAWLNHHTRFARVRYMSRGLHAANLLLLAGIVMIPWVTATLAEALSLPGHQGQQEVVLYGAVLVLNAIAWFFLLSVLARQPQLLEDPTQATGFANDRFAALMGGLVGVVGATIGYFWSPIAATVLFLAMPIFYATVSEGFEPTGEVAER
jgi:uncharacterized membrane protein